MPYDESVVALVGDVLVTVLLISAPILGAGVCIGLIISIVQSITSIQDQTLTFVPKIFVMLIVAILLLPWIVQQLVEYAVELFLFQ